MAIHCSVARVFISLVQILAANIFTGHGREQGTNTHTHTEMVSNEFSKHLIVAEQCYTAQVSQTIAILCEQDETSVSRIENGKCELK